MDAKTGKALISIATVFLAGGAVGGFVGWVEGQRKGRREAWLQAETEMDQMEERLKRLYKVGEYSTPFVPGPSVEPAVEGDNYIPMGPMGSVDPAKLQKLREHIETQGYANMAAAQAGGDKSLFERFSNEDLEEANLEGSLEVTPSMIDPEPYVITEAEFQHDEETYTKISLEFYPGDRVVTDDQERVVDDVETSVGLNNLNYFSPDNTVVYVRNNRLEADFEISLQIGSYRETVLGEPEAPVMERRGRKSRPKDE